MCFLFRFLARYVILIRWLETTWDTLTTHSLDWATGCEQSRFRVPGRQHRHTGQHAGWCRAAWRLAIDSTILWNSSHCCVLYHSCCLARYEILQHSFTHKSCILPSHLMLCLLFTMKGRSWETKMAQKQEGLCCNVWLYSEGEMLRCQIAGGGLCREVFCWNWIHLTMKPGRQGSPTWVWKHRSHFAEERIVEAKHLRFQGFLPRTWRGPPHHRPSEPIVDSDQQHLGSPQSASHQFSCKRCLQNLAAFPIGSSWCRLAPSCLWLSCCDHQSWKIQLKSPVLSSHGFHEKEG